MAKPTRETGPKRRIRVSRQRKMEAVRRLRRGDNAAEIAHSLDVAPQVLEDWNKALQGVDAAPGVIEGTSAVVLEAAVREFGANGLAGARIDRIAAVAGVNKTALYYHFGNKEELFAAALEFGYAQFGATEPQRKDDDGPAIGELARWVGVLFDRLYANRLHAKLIADENRYGGRHLGPALHARIRSIIVPVIAELRRLIARGQQEGSLRPDIDVIRLYLSVISLGMFYLTNATTLVATVGLDLSDSAEVGRWRAHVIDFVIASVRLAP